MLALLENPAEADHLWADPSLVPSATEETLRFDGPAPMVVRQAKVDTDVAGQTIPAGTMTMLGLAMANRDPRHFDDPDRFDVTRNPRDHVGFGYGIHLCLGAPLARLESKVVFETLIARVGHVRPNGPVERNPNGMFRGLQHLPIAFEENP
jgi:cytochrome P450